MLATELDQHALIAKLETAASAPPGEESLALCEAVLAALERADATTRDLPLARATAARALFEKARLLSRLGRSRESQSVVADLVRRYEHDVEPAARRLVCRALFGRAKDRLAEESVDRRVVIVDYRHILHIAERPPTIEVAAVEALYHLALTHGKIANERSSQEHREKAAERFLEVERRFGSSREPEIIRWVARCALSHAILHRLEVAGPMYDAVFNRYAGENTPELRAYAAEALLRWGARCLLEGKRGTAVALADRVLTTFAAAEGKEVRAQLENAERLRDDAKSARD